jgi:hypothetical protein
LAHSSGDILAEAAGDRPRSGGDAGSASSGVGGGVSSARRSSLPSLGTDALFTGGLSGLTARASVASSGGRGSDAGMGGLACGHVRVWRVRLASQSEWQKWLFAIQRSLALYINRLLLSARSGMPLGGPPGQQASAAAAHPAAYTPDVDRVSGRQQLVLGAEAAIAEESELDSSPATGPRASTGGSRRAGSATAGMPASAFPLGGAVSASMPHGMAVGWDIHKAMAGAGRAGAAPGTGATAAGGASGGGVAIPLGRSMAAGLGGRLAAALDEESEDATSSESEPEISGRGRGSASAAASGVKVTGRHRGAQLARGGSATSSEGEEDGGRLRPSRTEDGRGSAGSLEDMAFGGMEDVPAQRASGGQQPAAAAAAQTAAAPAAPAASSAAGPRKYVPPHMRGAAAEAESGAPAGDGSAAAPAPAAAPRRYMPPHARGGARSDPNYTPPPPPPDDSDEEDARNRRGGCGDSQQLRSAGSGIGHASSAGSASVPPLHHGSGEGTAAYGVWSAQGSRARMEDAHAIYDRLEQHSGSGVGGAAAGDGTNGHGGAGTSYFAVFDGHVSRFAADFARERLHTYIVGHQAFGSDLRTAVAAAFHRCDMEFLRGADLQPRPEDFNAGTTALAAFLRAPQLLVACLGDCRAVLCRVASGSAGTGGASTTASAHNVAATHLRAMGYEAVTVSVEHTPERERSRIEAAGGWVAT